MKRLRTRILIPLLAIAVGTIAVMFLLMDSVLKRQETLQARHRQMGFARMISHSLIRFYHLHNYVGMAECVAALGITANMIRVQIISISGEIIFANDATDSNGRSTVPDEYRRSGAEGILFRWDSESGVLASIQPIHRDPLCQHCSGEENEMLGYAFVKIAPDPYTITDKQSLYLLVGSSALIVIILISTAFGVHFRYVKSSLAKIESGIAEFEQGNFDSRINIDSSKELGNLAQSINQLGERLERMRRKLNQHYKTELERADRMASVGELAASIAHEIKNPVAGISNVMQVLITELPPNDEREPIFEEIMRQAQRVNQAVNDLLAYARPAKPEFSVGTINEPLTRALILLEGQIRSGRIEIVNDFDPEPPEVMVDHQLMQQVFVNLVMNAIQAMPDGGTLALKSGHDEETVFAEVQDTGPGIPTDRLAEIFKPFFTTKHKGTGLGLAISQSIVENHCGKITVETTLNKGTTFRIILPKHNSKKSA